MSLISYLGSFLPYDWNRGYSPPPLEENSPSDLNEGNVVENSSVNLVASVEQKPVSDKVRTVAQSLINPSQSSSSSTSTSSASSSSSSSSAPSLKVCKDTVKVWKQVDKALGLNSAPDYLQWTTAKQWTDAYALFNDWLSLQLENAALKSKEKTLDLSKLSLSHLPDWLAKLSFSCLDLRSNKLEVLPDWIFGPSGCSRLYLNSSTFKGDYKERYTEFMVKSHTSCLCPLLADSSKNDSLKDLHCLVRGDTPWMQIDKYMVIRRYVFPIMFMDQEMPQVLIPDSFNIELIRNVLAEGNFASNFNVLRTQVNDEALKFIKANYPLAEAFLTGKASGVNIEPV